MTSELPSCSSQFSWMRNDMGQDPCTIAAWLIILCQDSSSSQPAQLGLLTSTLPSYKAPNGTSANACTCSWAFYNNIEACTACQNFSTKDYPSWSSSCDVLGQSSTTTYWQASVSFSERTKLPRWSILNPSKWSAETFNASEAEEIAGQNLPDVTDALATQPSGTFLSSPTPSSSSTVSDSGTRKTNVGAIAGGVVAGVFALSVGAFAAWRFLLLLYKRRGRRLCFGKKSGTRQHLVDLDADGDGILDPSPLSAGGGSPLMAPSQTQSLGTRYSSRPTGPQSQSMQQIAFHGHPVMNPQSRNDIRNNNMPPTNIVVGITRTGRNSRKSRTTTRIPTVAEQLDEKRRIRAERANASAHAHRRASSLQAQVSANPSVGDLANTGNESGGNTSEVNAEADASALQSQSKIRLGMEERTDSGLRSSASADNINTNTNTNIKIAIDGDNGLNKRIHASRLQRLSLKNKNLKMLWNRRRTVMNLGSDADCHSHSDEGSSPPPPTTTAPLWLPLPLRDTGTGTVATVGETTNPGEVMAAVPGARLPSAREREKPPPGYIE